METGHIMENNSQNCTFQNTLIKADYGNGLYICVPTNLGYYGNNSGAGQHFTEEPMNLSYAEKSNEVNSCYNTVKLDLPNLEIQDRLVDSKKRGRKRKFHADHTLPKINIPTLQPGMLSNLDSSESNDHKQEVLKAAKSLFSKRTRTLYHWMYPNAPKAYLKAAVASSWETLGAQEKKFYISQVLGRFGFSQSNLMVNPQLGTLPPLEILTSTDHGRNEETNRAISSITHVGDNTYFNNEPWEVNSQMKPGCPLHTQRMKRSKNRAGRLSGNKIKRQVKDDMVLFKQNGDAEEFLDDPELNQELQQFRWNLHITDINKQ